jgi:hypothetical protein
VRQRRDQYACRDRDNLCHPKAASLSFRHCRGAQKRSEFHGSKRFRFSLLGEPALTQKEGRPPPPTRRFPPPHRLYRLQFRGGLRSTWDLPNPTRKCQNKKLFRRILLGNAKTKSCFAKSYQEMPKQKVVLPNPTRKSQNKKLFCRILLGNPKTKSCSAKSC